MVHQTKNGVAGEAHRQLAPPTIVAPQQEEIDFDDVLELVGNADWFQHRVIYVLVYPVSFLLAWMVLNILFMISVPDHWCHVPGRELYNMTVEEWKNLTIPRVVDKDSGLERLSQCSMYNLSIAESFTLAPLRDANGSAVTTSCINGWEYDKSSWKRTAVTDFDWVCADSSVPTTILTMNSVGSVVGTMVYGIMTDMVGRKPVFFLNIAIFLVCGTVNVFAPTFIVFVVSRAIAQTTFPSLYNTFFTLAVEVVGPSLRGRVNAVSFIVWTVSMCSLPLVAWLTADWKLLGLITILPAAGFFCVYRYIPESPRWLISVRRKEEAKKVLIEIANVNKKEVPKDLDSMLDQLSRKIEHEKKYGIFSLFQYRLGAIRTVLLTFCFIGNIVIYYGLQMNVANMGGNEFLNFFLLSAVEAPANAVGWLGSEHLGRRWTEVGAFLVTGVSCLTIMPLLFYPELEWLVTTLAIVAKFSITVSFFVVFLQSAEIYPTVLRGSGQALGSTMAYAVAIGSPAIIYLSNTHAFLPYMILGLIACICSIMASFLPETLGTDMPQCVEDTKDFLHDQAYFSWVTSRSLKREAAAAGGDGHCMARRRSVMVVSQEANNGSCTTSLMKAEDA